jgi:hypothetical protein
MYLAMGSSPQDLFDLDYIRGGVDAQGRPLDLDEPDLMPGLQGPQLLELLRRLEPRCGEGAELEEKLASVGVDPDVAEDEVAGPVGDRQREVEGQPARVGNGFDDVRIGEEGWSADRYTEYALELSDLRGPRPIRRALARRRRLVALDIEEQDGRRGRRSRPPGRFLSVVGTSGPRHSEGRAAAVCARRPWPRRPVEPGPRGPPRPTGP